MNKKESQKSQKTIEKIPGNTSRNLLRRMCFTWNNYGKEDMDWMINQCKKRSWLYIIGREIGENGTPHLQGYVEFNKKQIEFTELKGWFPKIHIEKPREKRKNNLIYCSKDGSFETNFTGLPEPIIDPLEDKTLYPYQQEIVDLCLKKPHDRKIYWYWEPTGCRGKTNLIKHLCIKNKRAILGGWNAKDTMYAITKMKSPPNVVFFNIPRSKIDNVNYGLIESIKDGIFFSSKFESGMFIMNPPHIIIFSNEECDKTQLSPDRWVIRQINQEDCDKGRASPPLNIPPLTLLDFV